MNITVTAANVAPVNTVPGAQTVSVNTVLAIGGISVADANGDLASTQLSVAHGTLTVSLSGGATISSGANGSNSLTISGTQADINATLASLNYQGDLNYSGADTLTVLSTDSQGASDSDTVNITVTAANVAPVNTVPGAQTVSVNTVLAIGGISVADANGDLASTQLSVAHGTLTVSLSGGATISSGANGSNSLTISGTQADINATLASLNYQGDLNYSGADTLTVLSTDSQGASDRDSITILVGQLLSLNGQNDFYTTKENTTLQISAPGVLINDGFLSVSSISVLLTSAPAHGSLVFSGDGSFSYTPNNGYIGYDAFTYRLSQGNLVSNTIVVSLLVEPMVLPLPEPPLTPIVISSPVLPVTGVVTQPGTSAVINPPINTSNGTQILPQDSFNPNSDLPQTIHNVQLVNGGNNATPTLANHGERLSSRASDLLPSFSKELSRVRSELLNSYFEAEQSKSMKLPESPQEYEALSNNPVLLQQIEQMHKAMNEAFEKDEANKELTVNIVSATGISLATGIVSWLMRTGSLAASLLTILPAWKSVDPLSILVANTKKSKQTDEQADKDSELETQKKEDKDPESMFIAKK